MDNQAFKTMVGRHRAALRLAKASGDQEEVIEVCETALREFEQTQLPRDWGHWQAEMESAKALLGAQRERDENLGIQEAISLVISGDPVTGFSFFGPFAEVSEAVAWSQLELAGAAWWVTPLVRPKGGIGNGLGAGRSVGDQDVWGENAAWPRTDWHYEVANGDTNQGYWDWVTHQREAAANDAQGL
jgi:hypothetical protein